MAWGEGEAPRPEFYTFTNLDGMAHVMKGNFGVFLSGLESATCDRVRVEGVTNEGQEKDIRASASAGVMITGAGSALVRRGFVTNVRSCGSAVGVECNESSNVVLKECFVTGCRTPVLSTQSTVSTSGCGPVILRSG